MSNNLDYKPSRTQPVAGIEMRTLTKGSKTYVRLIHLSSGKYIIDLKSVPIKGGVTEFGNIVLDKLGQFDWTVSENCLMKNKKDLIPAVLSLLMER